jgi:hypothetical protein
MTIPYVAVGSGECQECDRLLNDVMKASDGQGFEQLSLWLKHANSNECQRRNTK